MKTFGILARQPPVDDLGLGERVGLEVDQAEEIEHVGVVGTQPLRSLQLAPRLGVSRLPETLHVRGCSGGGRRPGRTAGRLQDHARACGGDCTRAGRDRRIASRGTCMPGKHAPTSGCVTPRAESAASASCRRGGRRSSTPPPPYGRAVVDRERALHVRHRLVVRRDAAVLEHRVLAGVVRGQRARQGRRGTGASRYAR